jgi:hypothetical protein
MAAVIQNAEFRKNYVFLARRADFVLDRKSSSGSVAETPKPGQLCSASTLRSIPCFFDIFVMRLKIPASL